MNGQILIRGLEFQGNHGATAEEHLALRPFQVDVDIEADLSRAASSDQLSDAIDYYKVCDLITTIGTTKTYCLIEALAGAILSAITENWPATSVTVEVRKPNPPCPGNPSYTAVRLTQNL